MSINEKDKFLADRMKQETGYGTLRDYLGSKDYESRFKDCNVRLVMHR